MRNLATQVIEAYTYDDLLLVPQKSTILPSETVVRTQLTTHIALNVPLVSAAMDRVTEVGMATIMALNGGLGIIHKNLSPKEQADQVERVKRYQSGVILDPITVSPTTPLSDAIAQMGKYNISSVPVTDDGQKQGRLLGILTHSDFRFVKGADRHKPVSEFMTANEHLIKAQMGISLDDAQEILQRAKKEKLLLVDETGALRGLITAKDMIKAMRFPQAVKDSQGRLLVGAAIGIGKGAIERAELLVAAGVDVIVLDSAHGHSQGVMNQIQEVREAFPDTDLVAGNVATYDATRALIDLGVDAVKVGIGAGSICTTRVVAGVGVPMMTAINDCARAAEADGIPIIADGGLRYSGDIVKALAAGASSVMMGMLFAGTDESPGDKIIHQGREYKEYRGMGSIPAMKAGSSDRYFQDQFDLESSSPRKLVAEGVEGRVAHKGPATDLVFQMVGGLRAGMGYVGAATIPELWNKPVIRITNAGFRESHVHDVIITQEPPNYRQS